MHCVVRRANGQQTRNNVEVDRVYPRFSRAPPELIQFLSTWNAPYADDSAFVRGCSEERASRIDGKERDG